MSTVESGTAAAAAASEKGQRIEHEGILDVRDLKAYFKLRDGDVKAVDGVSFLLEHGKSLGLAGESGCGKTNHIPLARRAFWSHDLPTSAGQGSPALQTAPTDPER